MNDGRSRTSLSGTGKHKLEWRWHLPPTAEVISKSDDMLCLKLVSDWYLKVNVPCDGVNSQFNDFCVKDGWESLYYSKKERIVILSVYMKS